MKPISIKMKITLWHTAFIFIITMLMLTFIISISRKFLGAEFQSELIEETADFVDDIEVYGTSYYYDDPPSFYEDGILFSVYNNQGQLLEGSVPNGFPLNTTLNNGLFQEVSSVSGKWMTYDVAIPLGSGQYLWVRGVSSSEALSGLNRIFLLFLFVSCPILVITAALGGYFITKRAFKPVEKIRETADIIGKEGDLSKRIPVPKAKDELYALTDTFNTMLSRLEEAFQNERQFTADASHELRTPTAVILSQCEYALLPDATEKEYLESLSVIENQAKKMSALISSLLLFARADNKKQVLQMEKVDLSILAEMVVEELTTKAEKKQITLFSSLHPDVFVMGDQSFLMRLFINLIENSIHYGKEGGTTSVKLYEQSGQALCRIEDNGIGISKDDLPNIWKRFYRADKARTLSNESGTGLGLSMVQWIVNAHHGHIEVESSLSQGTCFTFFLPLVPSA